MASCDKQVKCWDLASNQAIQVLSIYLIFVKSQNILENIPYFSHSHRININMSLFKRSSTIENKKKQGLSLGNIFSTYLLYKRPYSLNSNFEREYSSSHLFVVCLNFIFQVAEHQAPVKACRWVKANNYSALMTVSWDKTLKFWDTRSPNPMMSINLPGKYSTIQLQNSFIFSIT